MEYFCDALGWLDASFDTVYNYFSSFYNIISNLIVIGCSIPKINIQQIILTFTIENYILENDGELFSLYLPRGLVYSPSKR